MRIAFVTREYPPDTAWGGIGSFYFSLATALARAGHEVEVFAQSLDEERLDVEPSGVIVHRVLGRKDGWGEKTGGSTAGSADIGLFAVGLANAMHTAVLERHVVAPFDIIEGHEHLGINAVINSSDMYGAATITRYHTAYETLVKRGIVDWPVAPLITSLERTAIEKANYRISTSEVISKIAADDFDAPEAEAIIPNFVRTIPYDKAWGAKKNQILFVGRLVLGHKRPDIAVQAFAKFAASRPNWRMLVVGPNMDHEAAGNVWKYCEGLRPKWMAGRIKYVGPQPQDEVYRLMAESKAIIVPSDFESFGMVAVEAMQNECLPFVSSDTALADLPPDPRLVCARGDAGDFARKLELLLDDKESAALAATCRQHALDTFSERSILLNNVDFYTTAVAAHRQESHAHTGYAFNPDHATDLPRVSIVVPSYNSAAYIGETLESLVTQDYANLEVIVCDGGSTDGTVNIVNEYQGVTLISEPDKGQAHAINKGMLYASGDIIAYLNSDDVYRPGAIRKVVAHFRRKPQAKILVGECDYIDERSAIIGHMKPVFTGVQGIVRYWGWEKWHCIPQQSTFWRREIVELIGLFDSERHFVMDLDYWIRVARRFPFEIVPDTLAAFRLVTGTKTVSNTDRMYLEELDTFLRYRKLLPWHTRLWETIVARRHYSERLIGFAESLYLNDKLRRAALRQTYFAIKRYPPRIFDIHVWLMVGHVAATALGLESIAARVHRKLLGLLWRMKHRTA